MTYYQKTISNLSLILFSLSLILMANYSFGANPESDPRQLWEPHASLFGGSTTLTQIESDDSPFASDLPPLFESDIAQFGDSTEPFAYSHGALFEFDDPTISPATQLGRPALPDIACVVPRQTRHAALTQNNSAEPVESVAPNPVQKIREKPYKCEFAGCTYATAHKPNFTRHRRMHTGEKPFKCEVDGCTYATGDGSNLTTHRRTHAGEKPFPPVTQLGRQVLPDIACVIPRQPNHDMLTQSNPAVPVENVAPNPARKISEKRFKCEFAGCTYATAASVNFATHQRTHTDEKPFKCEVDGCKFAAVQKNNLTKHIKTHTNGGPHSCKHPGCKCCFTNSKALTFHKKQHDLGQDAPMAGKRKRNDDTLAAKMPHKAVSFDPNALIPEDATLHSPKRTRLQGNPSAAEKLIILEEEREEEEKLEKRKEKNDDESAISLHALIPNHEDTKASAAYAQDKFNDHGTPALPAIVGTDIDIADAGVIDEQTNFHLDEWSMPPELLNNLSPKKIEDMTPEFDDPTILPVTQLGRQVLPDIAYVIPRQPNHDILTQSNPAVPVESVAPNPVQKIREKRFKCEFDGCNYATAVSVQFTEHQRTHTGEKPFKCTFAGCKFAAAQKGELTNHIRTHTGEKPFKCTFDGCKFAAAQKGKLIAHRKTHTGEKPFKCTFDGCKFAATEKGGLNYHIASKHTSEKPFKCGIDGCEYAAAKKSTLTQHQRMHTGEKSFKCEFDGCEFAAIQKNNLTRHIKTHTNGGPHSCKHPGCKCCFISSYALTLHKKQHELGQDAPMAGKRKRNDDTLAAKMPHKAVSFDPNALIPEDATLHSPKRTRLQGNPSAAEKLIILEEEREEEEEREKREEKNDDESAISLHALIPNHEDTEASAAYEQDKFNDHGAPALPAIVDTDIDIADAGVIDEQTNFHLDEWSISPELLTNLPPKKLEDMTPDELEEWQIHIWDLETSRR